MPYSLLQHNTFGIEASCRQFVEYASVAQLKEVAATLGDPFDDNSIQYQLMMFIFDSSTFTSVQNSRFSSAET